MNCKDCIHSKVCTGRALGGFWNAEKDCADFKDRSKFIELPCKVGDIIYKVCPTISNIEDLEGWEALHPCNSCGLKECDLYDRNDSIIHKVKAKNLPYIVERLPYFGSFYFVTRQEAEQSIKERKVELLKGEE